MPFPIRVFPGLRVLNWITVTKIFSVSRDLIELSIDSLLLALQYLNPVGNIPLVLFLNCHCHSWHKSLYELDQLIADNLTGCLGKTGSPTAERLTHRFQRGSTLKIPIPAFSLRSAMIETVILG